MPVQVSMNPGGQWVSRLTCGCDLPMVVITWEVHVSLLGTLRSSPATSCHFVIG